MTKEQTQINLREATTIEAIEIYQENGKVYPGYTVMYNKINDQHDFKITYKDQQPGCYCCPRCGTELTHLDDECPECAEIYEDIKTLQSVIYTLQDLIAEDGETGKYEVLIKVDGNIVYYHLD